MIEQLLRLFRRKPRVRALREVYLHDGPLAGRRLMIPEPVDELRVTGIGLVPVTYRPTTSPHQWSAQTR